MELSSFGFAQTLRNYFSDAIAAHSHAVKGVGYLHGALLVGDDDELRARAQVLEDLQQAAEVGIVKRCLNLVHDVERRRASLEDGD